MKKIIHMSDLHVGYKDNDDRFYKVIEKIKFERGDRAGEYVIVITGDLIDNAHQRDSCRHVKAGLNAWLNVKLASCSTFVSDELTLKFGSLNFKFTEEEI